MRTVAISSYVIGRHLDTTIVDFECTIAEVRALNEYRDL